MNKLHLFVCSLFILFGCTSEKGAAVIHVSVTGRSAAPGKSSAPTSLSAALDYIKDLRQAENWPKHGMKIKLSEGTYFLEEPILLDSLFLLSNNAPLHFENASLGKVVFSGGKKIKNWESLGSNIWKTTLPEVKNNQWYFRQLFANGRRLKRARTPNSDWFFATGPLKKYEDIIQPWQFGKMIEVRRDQPEALCGFGFKASDLEVWEDTDQAEVLWLNSWDASWHSIRKIDTINNEIYFNSPANWTVGFYPGLPRYRVENVRQALDQAGEWYLHKDTGELFYFANPKEDPNKMDFIAPVLEKLLIIKGSEQKKVSNISFQGIEFSHSTYPLGIYAHTVHEEDVKAPYDSKFWNWPEHAKNIYPDWPTDFLPGYTDPQAAVNAGEAIILTYAEGISFDNCAFTHLGANAFRMGTGVKNCIVQHSSFEDLGAGAIHIGLPVSDYQLAGLELEETPAFNVIQNNLIRHGGKVHPGAVGIWLAQAHDNQILNNEIAYFGYSGVSIGWTWGKKESYARNNLFANNEIHHVMEVLADGGAFYSLGPLPGNVYRENYIHHISRSAGAIGSHNNGIFFDEGSEGIIVERNVIHDITDELIRFNASHDSNFVFQNNFFGTDSILVKANYDYNTLEAAKNSGYVKIRIPNNHYNVYPESDNFPAELAKKAGVQH